MGKLTCETCIQHASHPHRLTIMNLQNPPQSGGAPPLCAGCNHQTCGSVYACMPCNFMLHLKCAQMPPRITHPGHPKHSLTLLTKPIYTAGFFHCDGCGQSGKGFSYHCHHCDFDLHILCATKPLLVSAHHLHHHQLGLAFRAPYNVPGFSCDVCGTSGNHWLYRCDYCSFDAHVHCATTSSGANSSNGNNNVVGGGSQSFQCQQQQQQQRQSYLAPLLGQSHPMFSWNYQSTPVSVRTRVLAAAGHAIVKGAVEGVAQSGADYSTSCDNGFDYDVDFSW